MGAPLLHDDISSGFNLPYAMLSYVKLRSRVVLIVASAFLVFTFYTLSLASGSSANPVVDLGYARYVGQAGPNSVSQWLGVRYAAPPLGNLRFAEPQDPVATNRLHKAHKVCQLRNLGACLLTCVARSEMLSDWRQPRRLVHF